MAVLLFRLNGAPEDERLDILQLLEDHDITCYETSAGNWGVSVAGIWLHHDSDYPRAKALVDAYQAQRQERFRRLQQQEKAAGRQLSWWQNLRRRPLQVIVYWLLIAFFLYLSTVVFIGGFS